MTRLIQPLLLIAMNSRQSAMILPPPLPPHKHYDDNSIRCDVMRCDDNRWDSPNAGIPGEILTDSSEIIPPPPPTPPRT